MNPFESAAAVAAPVKSDRHSAPVAFDFSISAPQFVGVAHAGATTRPVVNPAASSAPIAIFMH
jgi:hypothetical protein